MRVLVDLRSVDSNNPSGLARYSQELVRAIGNLPQAPQLAVVALPGFTDDKLNAEVITARSKCLSLRQNLEFRINPPWRYWQTDIYHYPHFNAPPSGGVALVSTIHDLYPLYTGYTSLLRRSFFKSAIISTLTRSRRVICVSEYTRQEVQKHFPDYGDKLCVMGEAPRSDLVVPAKSEVAGFLKDYELSEGYILYVGNAKPHKNLQRLLQAYAKLPLPLREKHNLVFTGNTRMFERAGLVKLAQQLGLDETFRLVGRVEEADMATLYGGAYLLAQVSLMEGFGLPILEAGVCGTPCLVARAGAMPDTAGDAAMYVDPLDVNDIYRHLRLMLEDVKLRRGIAKSGQEWANHITWADVASRVVGIYEEALQEN